MILSPIEDLIKKADCEGLRALLSKNPSLANETIPLDDNPAKAHPLHRICDGVFNGVYPDQTAADMARIFLEFGANVNGHVTAEKKDTPLIAAASLNADEVALLYLDHGANVHHAGCHGGTALHWAAWCGRDRLVNRLILEKSPLEKRCIDFKGTPCSGLFMGTNSAVAKTGTGKSNVSASSFMPAQIKPFRTSKEHWPCNSSMRKILN